MFRILNQFRSIIEQGLRTADNAIARWTKPIAHAPAVAAAADRTRSKTHLIAENLLLRQQLVVLHRSVKRPRLTRVDRGLFIVLASRLPTWKAALLIVKPETVLRWHRAGFRLFWKQKSRPTSVAFGDGAGLAEALADGAGPAEGLADGIAVAVAGGTTIAVVGGGDVVAVAPGTGVAVRVGVGQGVGTASGAALLEALGIGDAFGDGSTVGHGAGDGVADGLGVPDRLGAGLGEGHVVGCRSCTGVLAADCSAVAFHTLR